MEVAAVVARFLTKCQERGLSPSTINSYHSRLKPFTREFLQLPLKMHEIEIYLRLKGETPSKRGPTFYALQALYSYLEEFEDIVSPVPPRGKVGRPSRVSRLGTNRESYAHLGTNRGEKKRGTARYQDEAIEVMHTEEAVRRFMASKEAQGISPRTGERYVGIFRQFIARFPILPLAPEPIEEYIRSIKGSPENRWTHQKSLRTFYAFLEARYKIDNPMRLAAPVKVPRKVRPTLELDQLQRLVALELPIRDKAIVHLLLDVGIRSGELLGMDREDVYPDHIKVQGKTGQRLVPISPDTYELLIGLAPAGPLFRTARGRMRRESLRDLISSLLERAGYHGPKQGPHILRHSYGRHYMALGGDLMSLKEILGHTKVTTTQIYAELAFGDVKKRHHEISPLRTVSEANHVHPEGEGQG